MKTKIYHYLFDVVKNRGAGYFVLIDPDQKNHSNIEDVVQVANESEVDALLVGGSLMMDAGNHDRVAKIKKNAKMPVIFFPGGVTQLNGYYDAMFFMSILSGRNPHYLIGEQAIAAPIVKDIGIETIPMGYLLIDGGTTTTVEFMSSTKPIPMDRPDITVAHALAAQYLGKKFVYLEAGSGAKYPVSLETIEAVKLMAREEGMFRGPEGNATLAGLIKLIDDGSVDKDESVVLFATANGLKYVDLFSPIIPILDSKEKIEYNNFCLVD